MPNEGLSIEMIRRYDPAADRHPAKFDIEMIKAGGIVRVMREMQFLAAAPVTEGETIDAAVMRRQLESWMHALKPYYLAAI